jgi:hypothetical protein
MKIKQEIEWVAGELPQTESLKLIAVATGDTTIASIGYYDKKAETWFRDDERAVASQVLAWASVPLFQGFPTEGQKVEFGDAYRCDNPNADKAMFGRLVIAVEFIARTLSKQIGSGFLEAGVHERIELNRTIRRLDTIKGYIMEGEEAGL